MPIKLKAYNVYPGNDSFDFGCILVFAKSRNQARTVGWKQGPWFSEYLEMSAIRVKRFDKYATGEEPYFFESNDELPEPFFYEGEI